jgi:rRNA-processing protein FCF1
MEKRAHAHTLQAMMNIVLDTNCLLMSLSRRIQHYQGFARFAKYKDGASLLPSSSYHGRF